MKKLLTTAVFLLIALTNASRVMKKILILAVVLTSAGTIAQEKTLERLQKELQSMSNCQISLTHELCDLDILDPEVAGTLRQIHSYRDRLTIPRQGNTTNISGECYTSSILKPTPFMGNNGEVFILQDRSIWEVKYEYSYMYQYNPGVVVCPSRRTLIINDTTLNIENISRAGTEIMFSNVSGSWEGWNGDTIVRLMNGQIWEQVGLGLSLSLGLGNEVFVYQKNGMHYMAVEDEDQAVAVRRLN